MLNLPINIDLSPELNKLIAEIDEFKGSWKYYSQLNPQVLESLKKIATIESIGSSTRIEGSILSNSQVEELLGKLQIYSFKSRDEEEVAGYAKLMNTIYESYQEINLSENYIRQMHNILLQHSSKDTRHRGNYKTLDNHVVAKNKQGEIVGIVFKTVTPFDTPRYMQELVRWANEALNDKIMHPLLIIGAFIVSLLYIHPFQDGNGRLSRAMTTLLLLKNNYAHAPYSSLESIIEASKSAYYLALRQTQTTLEEEQINWESWFEFFLKSLVKQKNHLLVKIENLEQENDLSLVQENIIELLQQTDKMRMSMFLDKTQHSRQLLKYHLKELVKKGLIKQYGQGRGTWYTLN